MNDKRKIMNDKAKIIGMVGGSIAIIVVLLFIAPWLAFFLSYFMGWIAKITIGSFLVEGLSLLGLTVPLAKIPLVAGTIGWIATFFYGIFNIKDKREA